MRYEKHCCRDALVVRDRMSAQCVFARASLRVVGSAIVAVNLGHGQGKESWPCPLMMDANAVGSALRHLRIDRAHGNRSTFAEWWHQEVASAGCARAPRLPQAHAPAPAPAPRRVRASTCCLHATRRTEPHHRGRTTEAPSLRRGRVCGAPPAPASPPRGTLAPPQVKTHDGS